MSKFKFRIEVWKGWLVERVKAILEPNGLAESWGRSMILWLIGTILAALWHLLS